MINIWKHNLKASYKYNYMRNKYIYIVPLRKCRLNFEQKKKKKIHGKYNDKHSVIVPMKEFFTKIYYCILIGI